MPLTHLCLQNNASVKLLLYGFMAVTLLSGCAAGNFPPSILGQDNRVGMRNAASIAVAREADGSLSLLYRQPDGRMRRSTLPNYIAAAEVIDSRERRSRAEYAAVLKVTTRPGHPTECAPGVPVERLFLSDPRGARLIDAPTCGEVVQLGKSDVGDLIGVLLPEGRWLRVEGTQLLPSDAQPNRSSPATPNRVWGPPGGQPTGSQTIRPAARTAPAAPTTPAPVVERAAPPPAERAAPRTIDPSSLPSGPVRQGDEQRPTPSARPVFGF